MLGMVYLDFWKKAFTYKGRDDKREFWLPLLVNTLVGIGLLVLVTLTHSSLTWLPLLWAGLALIPTRPPRRAACGTSARP